MTVLCPIRGGFFRAWKRPLAETLLNHPWLQELGEGEKHPEMDVPVQVDPKTIPDAEVLRMPQQ